MGGFKLEGEDNRDCGKAAAAYNTNPPHRIPCPDGLILASFQ